MKTIFLSCALLALLIPSVASAQDTWQAITYNVSFKAKNAGISVNGKFSALKTELVFSPEKLSASRLKGTVEAGTVNTGINMRDKAIKDDKYLDAAKFKLIEISSISLYPKNAQYAGMFRVTIKGVTKEMEIPFDFIPFGDQADFSATFTVNRRDFEVGSSSSTMADNVTIRITVKAKK